MTGAQTQNPLSGLHGHLLIVLGGLGCAGCAALVVGTVAAQVLVPSHDWVADTISDLAAGDMEIVMDVALYGFAVGLMATALASAHAHLGGAGWSFGVVSLAILAGLVIIVGARNEYGDNDDAGVVVHIYLVYALGALFLAMPLCMAAGAGRIMRGARIVLISLAVAWGAIAPVFLLSATSVDGLCERILGLIACATITLLSLLFISLGRNALRSEGRS